MDSVFRALSLSKDVFERRTSTGSEVFSLTRCLDAKKFVLISFFSLIRTIYQRVSTKPLPNDAKSPLPVDVRRSKTLLLKLLNGYSNSGYPVLSTPSASIATSERRQTSYEQNGFPVSLYRNKPQDFTNE